MGTLGPLRLRRAELPEPPDAPSRRPPPDLPEGLGGPGGLWSELPAPRVSPRAEALAEMFSASLHAAEGKRERGPGANCSSAPSGGREVLIRAGKRPRVIPPCAQPRNVAFQPHMVGLAWFKGLPEVPKHRSRSIPSIRGAASVARVVFGGGPILGLMHGAGACLGPAGARTVALEQDLLRTAAPKARDGGCGLGRRGWPQSRGLLSNAVSDPSQESHPVLIWGTGSPSPTLCKENEESLSDGAEGQRGQSARGHQLWGPSL